VVLLRNGGHHGRTALVDVPGEASPPTEFLTIAEAAQRVRCCERTIRGAIDSGALRAGRIHAIDGKRGGFRIRPVDLETWIYGHGLYRHATSAVRISSIRLKKIRWPSSG
jgi:excisionase family DNA binding protein